MDTIDQYERNAKLHYLGYLVTVLIMRRDTLRRAIDALEGAITYWQRKKMKAGQA